MTLEQIGRDTKVAFPKSDVATKCHQKFGYAHKAALDTPLLKVLSDLDITPLNSIDVEKYKEEKTKVPGASAFGIWLKWALPGSLLIPLGMFGAVGSNPFWAVASFLGFILVLTALGKRSPEFTTVKSWRKVPLNGYSQEIPEYVLRKALAINDACPEAYFQVDQLFENQVRTLDPFLVCVLDLESYYIEVWDERSFKGI